MKAAARAKRTGLAITGFIVGCGIGAGCQAVVGLWALVLPAGLALVALIMAVAAKLDGAQAHPLSPRLLCGDESATSRLVQRKRTRDNFQCRTQLKSRAALTQGPFRRD
jgi:hypothetical protein